MARALSVDRVVRVGINLQPMAAARRNFGTLLDHRRFRRHRHGGTPPRLYRHRRRGRRLRHGRAGIPRPPNSISPSPPAPRSSARTLGKTPTPAILKGGILSDGEADASAWASVKDGSFAVSVGGVSKDITGLDFSGVTNMNGVAAVVSAALASAGASCAWDGQRFAMKTSTLGASAGIRLSGPAVRARRDRHFRHAAHDRLHRPAPGRGHRRRNRQGSRGRAGRQVRRLVRLRLCRRGPGRRGSPSTWPPLSRHPPRPASTASPSPTAARWTPDTPRTPPASSRSWPASAPSWPTAATPTPSSPRSAAPSP